MEIILELVGELILQALGEILFEFGFHSVLETRKKRRERKPVVAAIGYLIVGAALGGISLLIFPESLIKEEHKLLNLIITPILAGLIMSIIGKWREKRGQELIRLDRFSYGFLFALGMALVRYFWTG